MLGKTNIQHITDEELVGKVRRNPDLFVYILERYELKIIRYIKRISGASQETVEDLAQETFIKAYLKLNQFDEKLKFSAWLYRIARNHVISHWRKYKKEKNDVYWDSSDHLERMIEVYPDLAGKIDLKMMEVKLAEALDRIKPIHKEVLILRYIEERDYHDIGDIIRRPIGSVGILLLRAKAELKKKIII